MTPTTLWRGYLWESKLSSHPQLAVQLCMQRYGHKTHDVIRVQCRITTRLCKKWQIKKVKIIKSFLLHHYTYLDGRTEAKSCWERERERLRTLFYVSLHSLQSTTVKENSRKVTSTSFLNNRRWLSSDDMLNWSSVINFRATIELIGELVVETNWFQ